MFGMANKKSPSRSTQEEINFLFEVGNVRHVMRTWNQFGGLPVSNNTEHMFRVAMTAWLIAEREGADTNRVVKMAIIHDIQEIRTGDINDLQRLYTTRDEKSAITDQTEGIFIKDEIRELWREFEERKTLEAKIVKDADVLDQDLECVEMIARGEAFGRILLDKRTKTIRNILFTKTAKEFFDAIRVSDPNAWHGVKNRFTDGDWKK
jgi:putative hydrolase of HD superfamily